ncbi:NAD(P)-dependent alcohol dehydrogenase [Acaryochloris marina]|uniref:Zinc-binding oxidoreductase, putative n=1 Tax=Acaryochloris marina (strain MBIC 11017) TaxID=329726 RepID=B0C649_ACAM1|nr:NAD(P)-dependent alcohol dehydrogenase [Acaryochloris marina]ABW31166.1 zinc-binding oxidoreductase, putative [Acaryochloris marina MBIC11017]BDM79861.1 NADPH:quinone reductase [Acaryochloris marina MBIC10699]
MKAIVLSNYGSPDQLELKDIEKPIPKDGEVLVKVHATTINDWDWCLVRGSPFYIRLFCGWRKPNIRVPGVEMAGQVETVGQNVIEFQPGDTVYSDISESGFGGFAEYVCVPETALAPMPEGMTFTEAAAIPHAAMLAIQGLIDAGQLQPGQRLLINGAGGGVGTLGVQIANAVGVQDVTGIDRASKFTLMRSVGFTHTIDYTQTDFTTGQERYDVILDTKTNRSPFKYLSVLNPGGTYVTVGGLTPRLFQVLLFGPMIRWLTQKSVRLVSLRPNKDLAYVNELWAAGQLKPAIDGPYSMNEVPRLIQYFGTGQHQGKVVVTHES